ncbi:MAG: hypothetical protein WCY16_01410 [Weeksellaceae bacterium]
MNEFISQITDLKAVLYGFLPLIIAIIEIIWSFKITIKSPGFLNLFLSLLILLLNGFSICIIVLMLKGGWPTYTTHIAILIASIFILIQVLKKKIK